jgi:hypothetical protein
MNLTCLFDLIVCVLFLFLFCWTTVVFSETLHSMVLVLCILVPSSAKSRKILVQQKRNKRRTCTHYQIGKFILKFIFYDIYEYCHPPPPPPPPKQLSSLLRHCILTLARLGRLCFIIFILKS